MLFQPGMQAGHLAVAVGEHAAGVAAVAAVLFFQVDGQHFFHAQALGNGADQEVRRSGNHQDTVASRAVPRQAAHGVGVDQRLDDVLDEGPYDELHLLGRAPHQRRQAEGHVVLHRQLAFGVERHEFVVLADEGFPIDPTQHGHVFAPQAGAVAVYQGVVKVEYCQGHQATSRIA
ncbi:hypothetical protein D3C72_1524120 [compost metagenome]